MPTPGSSLERAREPKALAAARADDLTFEDLLRRAEVLSKTDLVPAAFQGKPEAIVLVGTYGAELGLPLATSIQQIDVIENRPDPSAQLRVALVRRAGHQVRWGETTDERAVIFGRRLEYRGDPNAWVRVEWTMEQARRAELVARWVERWIKVRGNDGRERNKKETIIVGDDRGIFTRAERARLGLALDLPEWAQRELDAGNARAKDNWRKYPANMLRARAAKDLSRMEFSDVLAAFGLGETVYDTEADTGEWSDFPTEREPGDDPDGGDDYEDADVVDEKGPEPVLAPAPASPPGDGLPANPEFHDQNDEDDPPKPPTPTPTPTADEAGTWDGERWRAELAARSVRLSDGLRRARDLAAEVGVDPPASIDEVSGALGIALFRALEAQA